MRSAGLAVIGHPVAHSRSPDMQTAALAELGLAGEWTYGALDVAPEDFEAEVAELAAAGEYAGVNVTVPHKEAALAMADEASEARAGDRRRQHAELPRRPDRRRQHRRRRPAALAAGGIAAVARALVLGAGGAARAAIWALAQAARAADDEGEPTMVPAFEVDVWNRTAERAEAVAAELGGARRRRPGRRRLRADRQHDRGRARAARTPSSTCRSTPDSFVPGQVVLDMVYAEEPSALLAAAEAAGRDHRRRPRDAGPAGRPRRCASGPARTPSIEAMRTAVASCSCRRVTRADSLGRS